MKVLMMDSQHLIEQTVFDISFSTEDEAFAQQAVLNSFVSDEVMVVIDDVFDECTDVYSVLRIDHLEVDLGVVSYQNYQTEITARLREHLSVRLREYQAISRAGGGDGVLSIEREYSDLETLHYFVRYGHFPWYSQTCSVVDMQKKFMRVAELQCEDLIRLLGSMPSSEHALDNLAEVLLLEGFIFIARQLLHKEFDRALKVIEKLADYQFSQGRFKRISRQNRNACMRDLWSGLIAVLLQANSTDRNVAAAVRVFLMRCVGENLFEFEKIRIDLRKIGFDKLSEIPSFFDDHVVNINGLNQKDLISLSNFICVLASNNVVELRALWLSLLSDETDNQKRVGGILRHIAFYFSCRNQVIEQFTEKMLYEWFSITNTNQTEYIMACQVYFIHAISNKNRSEKQAYYDFWNYALHYCACYEAHQFDRSQFLYHLFHKESRPSKNKNKLFSFPLIDENNPFINYKNELHVVLDRLQHELGLSASASLNESGKLDAVTLSEYFSGAHSDNLKNISAQWHLVLESHSALLLHLIRIYGYKTILRHALIRALSSSQLRDLVGLLAPLSKVFTRDVVTLFSGVSSSGQFSDVDKPSSLCDEHCLWGFTLDFILVESGNRFNKKEYCGSLLRKMAAHNNCSYGELLDIMQTWFLAIAERHCITQELLAIINELVEGYSQFRPFKPATVTSSGSEVVALSQIDASDHDPDFTRTSVTYANEKELKKLFALIFGKDALTLSSYVFSLINAMISCLGKEQREKIHFETLMYSSRYFSSSTNITPAVFIQLLANYLVERAGCEAKHLYSQVILQLNQVDSERPVAQDLINHLAGNDVFLVKILNEKISDRPHESTLASVTYANETELKKLFALIFGKDALTLSSYVFSLINAMISCLGKEQREKIQFETLMFSSRYCLFGTDVRPEVFIRLLANYLMERSGCEAEHLYARVILQLNQADANQSVAQKVIQNLSTVVFPHFKNTPPPPVVIEASLFDGAAVYIKNAGQVLLSPYFPILFERLGLVKSGQFVDETASTRAVYALQYMVDGGVGELPEYMMILNKLICGVESGKLTVRDAVVRDAEKNLIDGLLAAAIKNWQGLGRTSVNGLRESFLKREGKLQLRDNQWHLLVESRSYDMLLDRIPWNYSIIKHAWMERVIHVEWR